MIPQYPMIISLAAGANCYSHYCDRRLGRKNLMRKDFIRLTVWEGSVYYDGKGEVEVTVLGINNWVSCISAHQKTKKESGENWGQSITLWICPTGLRMPARPHSHKSKLSPAGNYMFKCVSLQGTFHIQTIWHHSFSHCVHVDAQDRSRPPLAVAS